MKRERKKLTRYSFEKKERKKNPTDLSVHRVTYIVFSWESYSTSIKARKSGHVERRGELISTPSQQSWLYNDET